MTKKFLLRDLDSMDSDLDQHFSDDGAAKTSAKLVGRKRADQSQRMSGSNNVMAGKVSPNRGKAMPQISKKLLGKPKPEGHGARVSAAKKGVPNVKAKGQKRPEHSKRMQEHNPGLAATRVEWCCEHCGRTGSGLSNYTRWHGDRCAQR